MAPLISQLSSSQSVALQCNTTEAGMGFAATGEYLVMFVNRWLVTEANSSCLPILTTIESW